MAEARRKAPQRLWQAWWVRVPAYLIFAPIIMAVVDVVIVIIATVLMTGDLYDGLPSISFLAVWVGGQMVPLILPLILVELGNRRRGNALPPGMCALFVAVFSVGLMLAAIAVVQIMSNIPDAYKYSSWPFGVLAVLGCCTAGGAAATALVSPLIRRWAARHASVQDVSGHF